MNHSWSDDQPQPKIIVPSRANAWIEFMAAAMRTRTIEGSAADADRALAEFDKRWSLDDTGWYYTPPTKPEPSTWRDADKTTE